MTEQTYRERLRTLPVFPSDLPDLDPATTPDEPVPLFRTWLEDAVASGTPAPHAMTLSTAALSGHVSARTLLLKDIDDAGWHFATQRGSPKSQDLLGNPRAALTFFWPAVGRQVRLTGVVHDGGPEAGAADFRARPEASRAATLVGHQSEPLESLEQYRRAHAAVVDRLQIEPELLAPEWTDHFLVPEHVEFFQAAAPGNIRLRYRAGADGWTKELLWP
ncbi:pyridoxine/pyridoxamine 5'-phosphate oxidase [Georgenia subflava]|uniref:Pyridoxal 5'-phosphate synthase n=1 Tax=Georgenia subflava TaxID=1622177 RepID=A0A6N7ECK3_9MICO|nr:pyridoxal 5'-phosphate synthase [Georgenia subflava]MPV36152.1 pyridoxal 5'-phosphate synthase [Georgenia subflava]